MKKANEKYTILYARLSREDGTNKESESIQNQRLILEKYAEDNGFNNLIFKSDDGYSGTNFNRVAWNEVMELIENNQVENLIVKDACAIIGLNRKNPVTTGFFGLVFLF